MKWIILIGLLLLAACQSEVSTQSEPVETSEPINSEPVEEVKEDSSKSLKIASTEYPPYYGAELENGGFIAEIITEAFSASGYEIEIEFLPWARALEDTTAGDYHGLFTVWYREDREEIFLFSKPLPANELVFGKLQEKDISFNSYEDLTDKTIGVVRDYTYPTSFLEAGLTTEEVTVDEDNLEKLFLERVDLIVIDRGQGEHLAQEKFPEEHEKIEWLSPPIQTYDQFFVVPKALEEHQEILASFNAGLALIEENGKYKEILVKHGFEHYLD